MFIKETVREDYSEILETLGISKDERTEMIEAVTARVGIGHLLEKHPYDLSGGEQQKCALAKCCF